MNVQVISSTIRIFPNPASDVLNIYSTYKNNNNKPLGYKIVDVTGKIVKETNISEKIDVSTLQSGYYIIEFCTESSIVERKSFVITK
jgi:hypothetical protein